METAAKRIHPLVAGAAVSVILVSLVGMAAITGLLPNSHGTAAPHDAADAAPVAALSGPAAAPAPSPADLAASSAARDAARAVDDKYAKADADEPVKPSKHQQIARPKPVKEMHAQAGAPAHTSPAVTYPAPVQAAAPAPVYAPPPQQVAQAPACYDCGRVESVRAVQTQEKPSGVGVVGGAVLGGLLGNQVGGGNGRALATIAGAVGGGYAGNEVEKRTRTAVTYQVRVRMEDGQVRTFPYNSQPNWSVGDRVRVVDGYLRAAA